MTGLRYRLARWLVGGAFFRLPETGSWMVHHDAESQMTVGIRISEWQGSLTTQLAPFPKYGDPPAFRENPTTGEFSGRFA